MTGSSATSYRFARSPSSSFAGTSSASFTSSLASSPQISGRALRKLTLPTDNVRTELEAVDGITGVVISNHKRGTNCGEDFKRFETQDAEYLANGGAARVASDSSGFVPPD